MCLCFPGGGNSGAHVWIDDIEIIDEAQPTCTPTPTATAPPLRVPSQYDTIQDAIDAASTGNVVLVADGIYSGTGNKDLDFGGKAITVRSENGADSTTIDCEGSGRGFFFHSGEGSDSIVDGFTITDGSYMNGGGIHCYNSSPTIRNCVITDNSSGSGHGGGVYLNGSNSLIFNCEISENWCNRGGGGIYIDGGSPTIESCSILNNVADYNSWYKDGGGIYCTDGTPIIRECVIQGNEAEYGNGGGVCLASGSDGTVVNCLITGNTASSEGEGGGIFCDYSEPEIANCTVVGNSAEDGAGIACYGGPAAEAVISNCIVWDNPSEYTQVNGSPAITYTTVEGGKTGEGNSEENPLFLSPGYWDSGDWVEGNYHLAGHSPCIDSGSNELVPSGILEDLEGNDRFVDGDGEGGTEVDRGPYEHPEPLRVPLEYDTIQDAIDSATDGDLVLVANGTYTGEGNKELDYDAKAITVRSENGAAYTVIDCEGDGEGFDFFSLPSGPTAGPLSVVADFTIVNASPSGIRCKYDSPTITGCIIKDCSGPGVYCWGSDVTITRCTLSENSATLAGGGIDCSDTSNPTITDCVIAGNSAGWSGGGLYAGFSCFPEMTNCTLVGNSADDYGGGVGSFSGGRPIITNCILWDNRSPHGAQIGLYSWEPGIPAMVKVFYSDAQGGSDAVYTEGYTDVVWGDGNIDATPEFIDPGSWDEDDWVEGNHHLLAGSPCIDSGSNGAVPDEGSGDRDGNLRIVDGDGDEVAVVDMGAYEHPDPLRVPSEYDTIQDAIDSATHGDLVLVADGVYSGTGNKNLDFGGKAITVQSEDGAGSTIIDCEIDGQAFYFHSGEDLRSIVQGFTITNALATNGAIDCHASPTIRDCVITRNYAAGSGGGVFCWGTSPRIENCVIADNSAYSNGGGINISGGEPVIINCTIAGNWSRCGWADGGGIYCSGSATLINCEISGNLAGDEGGGISASGWIEVSLMNCVVTGNSARYGGGLNFHLGSYVLTNCTISSNDAEENGGGIYCSGDGLELTITNCILWGNSASEGPNLAIGESLPGQVESVAIAYSDVGGGTSEIWCEYLEEVLDWGEGNIDEDPEFALLEDFHLLPESPCIDAATTDPVGGLPETDIEGNDRSIDGDGENGAEPDMGAYEYNPDLPAIALSPAVFEFTMTQGGADPDDKTLQIRNAGGGTLDWEVSESCDWLEAEPLSGSATEEIDTVTLSVDGDGLSDGYYSCLVTVADASASNSPRTVSVALIVNGTLEVPSEYDTIQEAIDAAEEGDVVLVGDGTYTGEGNRNLDFRGKAITVRSVNGAESTIIDCEEEAKGFLIDYCSAGSNAVIEGFTIAHGSGPQSTGSGVRVLGCSAIILNCKVLENAAPGYGGGIGCSNASVEITNCLISGNRVYDNGIPFLDACGGGIFSIMSDVTLTNCTIHGNLSDHEGAGIYCEKSSVDITNCILWGDDAPHGPEITVTGSAADPATLTVSSSDVEGGTEDIDLSGSATLIWGDGNIDATPEFIDPGYWDEDDWVEGDQHLLAGSPCIDSGSNDAVPDGVSGDLDGNPRIVDGDGDEQAVVDMGAYEHADPLRVPSEYDTIQDAIDAAVDGDLVLVADGVYSGTGNRSLDFDGKAITVRSENGPYSTIIDREGWPYRAFYFRSGEGRDSVVDGFTLTRGSAIECDGASPTILNCVISDNVNIRGGGIYCYDLACPLIASCTITNNSSQYSGGGIECTAGSPVITDCVITGNECTTGYGGGIACGGWTKIANCLITGNVAYTEGSGIACYYGNNVPEIVNCTILGNQAVLGTGVASFMSTPELANCIIRQNVPGQVSGNVTVTYSNVEDGYSGDGNIDATPEFADPGYWVTNPEGSSWVDGDYHLSAASPCLDSGSNEAVFEWLVTDLDGRHRIVDGDDDDTATVDMGVYESPRILLVPSNYLTIQAAIDDAVDGEIVLVADGVYTATGNKDLDFGGRAILVRSENGPEATTIDCEDDGSGFTFHSDEGFDSIVDGFTITGADESGIWCYESSPTIVNCIVTGNSAFSGAGISCGHASDARILNCRISGNVAQYHGGGISTDYDGSPEITNCTIVGNSAGNTGGGYVGFSKSTPTLTNSIIWDCSAPYGYSIGFMDPGTPSTLTIYHSDVEGGTEDVVAPGGSEVIWGEGCIDEDPDFVESGSWNGNNWTEGDYQLQEDSPCIDSGTNSAVPSWLTDDLDDNDRIIDGDEDSEAVVDMGGYEYVVPVSMCKGPYLFYPGDNTEMTVLWQLDWTDICTLEWGTDTSYSDGNIFTGEYGDDHQHGYTIPDLVAGTKYYYRVTAQEDSHTGSFKAAPVNSATSVKILAYGDTRSWPADHDAVAAEIVATFEDDSDYQTLLLHDGDWVYSGDSESDWKNQYFNRGYSNALEMQASLAINGCMGNHEQTGALFVKYWPYPFVAGCYWSFDYGPVHIVVVDQYTEDYTPESDQLEWIEDDLSTSSKDWKIMLLHHPGWSAGHHANNEDVQDYLQPLCEEYGVELVFAGHNHYYARCDVPDDDQNPTITIHHITTGGGGADLYNTQSGMPYLVTATKTHNFCKIEIEGSQLEFEALDEDGETIDQFTINH